MLKLMKYEIKGTYRFVLATILVVALATVGIQYTAYNLSFNMEGPSHEGMMILPVLFPILIIMIMAASIAFIVYLIQSFRRELYEDRGYLTFTLPLSGKEILGAKFVTATLWSILFGTILFVINIIAFRMLFGGVLWEEISTQIGLVLDYIGDGFIRSAIIYSLVSSSATLLTVYLSITISKVAIRNRTIGGLWILIFIGLEILFTSIEGKIVDIFPLFTSMSDEIITSQDSLFIPAQGITLDIMADVPVLSISAIIYWIILGVGIFALTSYLLDRKIEL